MSFEIGDIVESTMYEGSLLYKIECFFDRGNDQACSKHQNIEAKPGVDDAHVTVVWKKHKAIAPAWPIGESVTFNVNNLRTPSNGMLVLALAAS